MLIYVLRRLVHMVPLLLVISFMSFSIMEAAPGNYLDKYKASQKISPETIRNLEKKYYLERSVWCISAEFQYNSL